MADVKNKLVTVESLGSVYDLLNSRKADLSYTKMVGSPYNLLDNSDFRNPVNQNGQNSYKGAVNGIDRWAISSVAWMVTIEDGYIKISDNPDSESTATGMFRQYINIDESLKGKTVTLAAKLKGEDVRLNINNIETGAYAGQSDWYIKTLTGVVPSDAETIFIALQSRNANEYMCEWVALYEGEYTVETLPEYKPKGYNVELLNCGGITAEYVGARPSTWMPNISDISGFINWFGAGQSIPANSDLDTYTTVGKYYVTNKATAETIANSPCVGEGYVLFVFSRTYASYVTQMAISNDGQLYIRCASSGGVFDNWSMKANSSAILQQTALVYEGDVNTLVDEKRYFVINCTNVPNNLHGFLEVKYYIGNMFKPHSAWGQTSCVHQRLETYDGIILERYGLLKADISTEWEWSEWEYVNPQIALGVEYRTTERWNGKVVYKRMTNVGTMPNNAEVTYDTYIPKAGTVINVKFIMFDANSSWWRSNHPTAFDYWCESQYTENYQLHVKVTSNFSSYTCYIIFEYTKD